MASLRIVVDRDLCEANGECMRAAPEVFLVDDNDKLIVKNTQLPSAASRVYNTAADNQTRVRVRVLQGEANQADACIGIGEC